MSVLNATDQNFEQEVIKSEIPVLVDFWAPWCVPCKRVAPILEEIAKDYEGRLKIAKVDVDTNNETAWRYGIKSIPTLILFHKGQVAEQIIGAQPKDEILKIIEKYLE
jgi:thioredoxin 1